LNSTFIPRSLQDVLALCPQNGQVVPVPAQHVCLVLDSLGWVTLIEELALSNDGVRQLDRRLVEDDQINRNPFESRGEKVRQLRAIACERLGWRKQYTQVDIAEQADLAADLRPEEIHQSYLRVRTGDVVDVFFEILAIEPAHRHTSHIEPVGLDFIVTHTVTPAVRHTHRTGNLFGLTARGRAVTLTQDRQLAPDFARRRPERLT
jgi:hypothetical protein